MRSVRVMFRASFVILKRALSYRQYEKRSIYDLWTDILDFICKFGRIRIDIIMKSLELLFQPEAYIFVKISGS